ncbi:MAG TPA: alpha/beta fold hydrolase [Pseudonocardiaceae bacterium]|jgi:pimeloyl-ACP methyl ester carboxylesterase
MRTELVSIATDTVPLDGAFHWPEDRTARGGVLLFHGNTMNFYIGAPRWLPPVLTELGFACLAFNRRGHDILSIRDSRAPEGGALQLTREAIADNEHAARWMADRGFPAPIVIAHSGGGLLGAAHAAGHPETPALVLLSAFRGGAGGQSIPAQMALAGEDYGATMARAQALVAAGRGKELMTMPNWWYVISAQSYVDRFTTLPDILAFAPTIMCPVLYVRGSLEPADVYPAEGYAERAGGPCEVAIVEGDHFYNGIEDHVCGVVTTWLKKSLPAAR